MYGLSKESRQIVLSRLKRQQNYLYENYITVGSTQIPYADFFQNAWHNSNRYIAELNHRVWSLNKYANDRGLKCIFAVFHLPSEYHSKRVITLKNGKSRLVRNDNFINDEDHSVSSGSKRLGEVIRSVLNSKAFRAIDKNDRCYITTREPHQDGTCHLNFMCFVPENFLSACMNAIERRFIDDYSYVSVSIDNPTAYIMKYIFKTLDDLRFNDGNLENLSDLTLWYIHYKIPRVTMSRTFVSLDVYRCLKGQYDLYKLSTMYASGALDILCDGDGKILHIVGEFGNIFSRNRSSIKKEFLNTSKLSLKRKSKPIFVTCDNKKYIFKNNKVFDYVTPPVIPSRMKDYELYNYYNTLDPEVCNLHHFGIVQNELIKRGLLEGEIQSLNNFNTKII